jgi:hypothetical protein
MLYAITSRCTKILSDSIIHIYLREHFAIQRAV